MYLNTVSFGNNTYGIKVAANKYFSKSPMKLKTEEAALLVGMLKATSTFNPINNPEKSEERRNVVITQMFKSQFISENEMNRLLKKPLKLNVSEDNDDLTKDSYIRNAVANYLEKWCEENDVDLYADGLKIYTTIDPTIQKHAEKAVEEWMKTLQKRFQNHWQNEVPWRDENGNEIHGNGVNGNLCIKFPWPGMIRTTYGDHERCRTNYFAAYENLYFTGDGCSRDEDGMYRNSIWVVCK